MTSPDGMSREQVARWLQANYYGGPAPWPRFDGQADAVIALVEAKVREAVTLAQTIDQIGDEPWHFANTADVVAKVMGVSP